MNKSKKEFPLMSTEDLVDYKERVLSDKETKVDFDDKNRVSYAGISIKVRGNEGFLSLKFDIDKYYVDCSQARVQEEYKEPQNAICRFKYLLEKYSK